MDSPRVTVLMPVLNGAAHLSAAIRSVLFQTLADLELLVVDDGSTDDSLAVVRSFEDPRIRLLGPSEHQGVAAALNRGLDVARGAFIARMDADDVSVPNRLSRQVDFLETHPEVGLCGAWARTLGTPEAMLVRSPADHDTIAAALFFGNALLHPSIVLRGSVVREHALRYDRAYESAEDFELWTRMAIVTRLASVPEILLFVRRHTAQTTTVRAVQMREAGDRVLTRQLRRLIPDAGDTDVASHRRWLDAHACFDAPSLLATARWARRLVAVNEARRAFPTSAFRRQVNGIQRRRMRRAIASRPLTLIATGLRTPRLGSWVATETVRLAINSALLRTRVLLGNRAR